MRSKGFITYLLLSALSLLLITLDLTDRVSALKDFLHYILFPSPQIAIKAVSETKKLGGNLTDIVRVFEKNRELRQRIEQLKYFEAQYKFLQKENDILRSLVGFSKTTERKMIPALVISRDPSRWFSTVIIDRGINDGIKPDMPVVAVSRKSIGLIGRTIESGDNFSKVMLITDPLSYVPAKISRSGEMCIVSGRERAELVIEYLSPGSDVRLGDQVVTSGIGEVFPGGIPVGLVGGRMVQGKTYFFQAPMEPEIKSGNIDKVLVITK